ncbi:MAG: GntR family transcriptional regulator [Gemmatimonadales bacterium]|nr:GntR family transcriptional regulator [Gemmatimonadales bacterium]
MIQRKPLRDEIQKEIVARIADGRMSPGQHINETHLASDLGISRTPLREAMLTLASAGFLQSDMGRGFLVPPLEAEEFSHLQAILARMAPFALSVTPPPPPGRLMELGNLFSRARLPGGQALPLGDVVFRFTWLLVEDCPNPLLRSDVLRLEGLARRYWRIAVEAGLESEPILQSFAEIYEMLRVKQLVEAQAKWTDHIERFGIQAVSFLARG